MRLLQRLVWKQICREKYDCKALRDSHSVRLAASNEVSR